MSEGPGLLSFDAVLASDGIAGAVGGAMAACRGVQGMSALLGWRVGDSGPVQTAGLPDPTMSIVTLVFADGGEDGI